eukprot:TRINITY_DN12420_c0_g3_i1.p1 TRINITY_DN12420_c0_g3~~TRINITY_DN12420_c0_g3_i1.p1  ORF type:complete len:535 (+),score=100.00 TRINITY_DN12420_c0_g3_i1:30-1607(+)
MLCSQAHVINAVDESDDPKVWQARVASELLELKSRVQEILELQSKLLDGQKAIHTHVHTSTSWWPPASPPLPKDAESDQQKGADDGPRQESAGTMALRRRGRSSANLKTLVRKELGLFHKLFTNSRREKTCLKRVVGSGMFELVSTVVVLLNTVCMGAISNCQVLQAVADPGATELLDSCDPVWLEVTFFSFYAVELLLKLAAWRMTFFTRREAQWNIFDLVIVLTGTLSFVDISEINVMWLRVVRVFRQLIKVLRVVRVVRFCDELRIILISVTSSMNCFFWSLVTLALIMYICAIVMVSGVTEYLKMPAVSSDELRIRSIALQHWGSLWLAMETLYRSVTGGGPWGMFVEPLQKAGEFYYMLFITYIAILVIGLLKLLTGMFVQHASAASNLDRDSRVRSSLEHLFHEMDGDGSGLLSVSEFQEKMNDPVTVSYFHMLQIDEDDIEELFSLADVDDDRQINIHEFIEGCQTYKGYAKKLDASYIRKQIADLTSLTESCLQAVQNLSSPYQSHPSRLNAPERSV